MAEIWSFTFFPLRGLSISSCLRRSAPPSGGWRSNSLLFFWVSQSPLFLHFCSQPLLLFFVNFWCLLESFPCDCILLRSLSSGTPFLNLVVSSIFSFPWRKGIGSLYPPTFCCSLPAGSIQISHHFCPSRLLRGSPPFSPPRWSLSVP